MLLNSRFLVVGLDILRSSAELAGKLKFDTYVACLAIAFAIFFVLPDFE